MVAIGVHIARAHEGNGNSVKGGGIVCDAGQAASSEGSLKTREPRSGHGEGMLIMHDGTADASSRRKERVVQTACTEKPVEGDGKLTSFCIDHLPWRTTSYAKGRAQKGNVGGLSAR
jgi:hypothetical protein